MKVCVWGTGHQIADTVATAFGLPVSHVDEVSAEKVAAYDVHIWYGILRGTEWVREECERQGKLFFILDNGYFGAGHFGGYYRISPYKTQALYLPSFVNTKYQHDLKPWVADGGYVLVCPPTEAVCGFYKIDGDEWLCDALDKIEHAGLTAKIRKKDSATPLTEDLGGAKMVVTFNSSVGWKALQMGIPCLSDPLHSVVGSYYNTKCIDKLLSVYKDMPRELLFDFLVEHQFTLSDIAGGKAWQLIERYMFILDGTKEKQ